MGAEMTPASVVTTTACVFGLVPTELLGRSRRRRLVEARSVAAYLAYELTEASYADVGAVLGGRTRQTTAYLVDSAALRLRFRDGRLGRMVAAVERALG
jgi:chromosomal replication initiator protein